MKFSAIGEFEIIRRADVKTSAYVERSRRAKQPPRRVYQKQIRRAKVRCFDGSKDIRYLAARHSAQDVRRGEAGVVQEICGISGAKIKHTKAMKQVVPVSCSAHDVIARGYLGNGGA